jgi:hypothetical protein
MTKKTSKNSDEATPSYFIVNGQPIDNVLEQLGLSHYKWQAILHIVRAGKKEGVTEAEDLGSALSYVKRELACAQRQTKQLPLAAARNRTKKAVARVAEQQPLTNAQPQPEATAS